MNEQRDNLDSEEEQMSSSYWMDVRAFQGSINALDAGDHEEISSSNAVLLGRLLVRLNRIERKLDELIRGNS